MSEGKESSQESSSLRDSQNLAPFWGHVEVFRWLLIRCIAVVFGLAVAAFCYKDFIFGQLILAPCNADFITYRLFSKIGMVANVLLLGHA